MCFLLTVTLHVFKIRKRAEKMIKVDSKSSNLGLDSLKNIDYLENYKQPRIAYNGENLIV